MALKRYLFLHTEQHYAPFLCVGLTIRPNGTMKNATRKTVGYEKLTAIMILDILTDGWIYEDNFS